MKKIYSFLFTSALCHLTFYMNAQFTNVQITSCYFGEGCIAIDPNNINRMVGGANLDYAFRSSDTGATWMTSTMTSTYNEWGDPCLVADNSGNFYFSHLAGASSSSIDKVVVQKSTDGGMTWDAGTYVGYNSPHGVDKPWMYFERATNTIYITWVQDAYSNNPSDSVIVFLSKSTDGAATWSTPVRVSKTLTGNGSQAQKASMIATGPNNEVYIGWCGPQGISFQKSTDGGNTWLAQDIHVDNLNPFWYFTVSGYGSWGTAFPSIACDLSNGAGKGNIYLCWSDQRNGSNNTDCFMARSTNGGTSWTVSKLNNDVTTSDQWHPSVAVDQSTGIVYAVFYDQRNSPATQNADIYLAYSTDAGNTYQNVKVTTTQLNSSTAKGDYLAISAEKKHVRPIWSGSNDVEWTALIDEQTLTAIEEEKKDLADMNIFPNPFSDGTTINYFLSSDDFVRLNLFDITGREIMNLENENQNEGWHKTNLSSEKLFPGIYFLRLETKNNSRTEKIIVTK